MGVEKMYLIEKGQSDEQVMHFGIFIFQRVIRSVSTGGAVWSHSLNTEVHVVLV